MADFWTISALTDAAGVGKFQEKVSFIMPVGQNGASATTHLSEAGASTDLVFASPSYFYTIERNGYVNLRFSTGARSAPDATAINLWVHTPYTLTTTGRFPAYAVINNTATEVYAHPQAGNFFTIVSATGATQDVNSFANANDYISRVVIQTKVF